MSKELKKDCLPKLQARYGRRSREADSVAHCGTSLAGSFIWSLTYTDILSGWTEGGAS